MIHNSHIAPQRHLLTGFKWPVRLLELYLEAIPVILGEVEGLEQSAEI